MSEIYVVAARVAAAVIEVLRAALPIGLGGHLRRRHLCRSETAPHGRDGGQSQRLPDAGESGIGRPQIGRGRKQRTHLCRAVYGLLYLFQPFFLGYRILLYLQFLLVFPARQVHVVRIAVGPRLHFIIKRRLCRFALLFRRLHRHFGHFYALVHPLVHVVERLLHGILESAHECLRFCRQLLVHAAVAVLFRLPEQQRPYAELAPPAFLHLGDVLAQVALQVRQLILVLGLRQFARVEPHLQQRLLQLLLKFQFLYGQTLELRPLFLRFFVRPVLQRLVQTVA